MGAGGGKRQQLQLLREGRHPKDKSWLGRAVPENMWSMCTISSTNVALTETRKRESLLSHKTAKEFEVSSSATRMSLLRQRVKAKENAASSSSGDASRLTGSTSQSMCAGESTPNLSRFDAMWQRIKAKEMAAKGFVH